MLPSDMPQGIFRFLVDTWFTVRVTFVQVIEIFTEYVVSLGSENVSLISILIGAGFFIYVAYVLIKFIVGIVL